MMRINGREVTFEPGRTVLEVAQELHIEVPTLCWDERLESLGGCRLCIVRANGRLVSSCTLLASDTLDVQTHDEEIESLRRDLVALTLSLVPGGPCPKCGEVGLCDLHALARRYAVTAGTEFSGRPGGTTATDPNPFLGRDDAWCIDCYRCVRICDEVEGDHAIIAKGRGFDTAIATFFEDPLEETPCELCGQCIHTCPTGALFDKKLRSRIEADGISPAEIAHTDTTCNYCGTGCGVTVHTARGKLLGTTPTMHAPASRGALCVKGQFGFEWVTSPDRLRTPLLREADGRFREASWAEAIDRIATTLAQTKASHGPDSIAAWASARSTSESSYALQRFMRGVIGTNNIDNCQRT